MDKFTLVKDLHMFASNLTYKYIFDTDKGKTVKRDEDLYKGFKVQDFKALKTLIQLLDENEEYGNLKAPRLRRKKQVQ